MNLLVINDFGVAGGGTEKRLGLLLGKLKKSGKIKEIHLLEHESSASKMDGIIIHKTGSKAIECFNKVRKIIIENNINLIQVHNLLLVHPIAILLAKILGIPVVWFAHDYWAVCGKRSFVDAENAIGKKMCDSTGFFSCLKCIGPLGKTRIKINIGLVNLVDAAVVPTHFMKNVLEKNHVRAKKWKKIIPWIDLENLSKIKKKKKMQIAFVGSLQEYKGARILAEAFNEIAENDSAARLIFIGKHCSKGNCLREKIEKAINKRFLKRVNFFPETEWKKIQEKVSESVILVFPTVCMESFGNVWAEAMALGTVPVISSTSGLKESAGDSALFFEPKNKKELARKILLLLKNKKLLNGMSKKAKSFAFKEFALERAEKEILELFESFDRK